MQKFEERDPRTSPANTFVRMRWMPLVLADMRDYAAERGQPEIAQEIEACRENVDALLALSDASAFGQKQ